MKIKNYIITMLLAAGLITSLSACVNDGGQVFGELPPGVSLVSGEVPEARSASYDELLHELRITWKTPIDPETCKGIEVTFQTLSGAMKTVKMYVNPNFPTTYDYFTVITNKPESVTYRCIWNKEGAEKEEVSEWGNVSDLALRYISSTSRFSTLRYPAYTLVDDATATEQIKNAYASIVGQTDEDQQEYYSNILLTVLSAAYYSTDDAGTQPVNTLKCILGHMDLDGAVAYVSSDNDGPLMKMSSEYVQQVANGSTSQEDAVFEIRGVLIHEFTHLIQANGPIGSNNPSGIEGYADAIRCACGGVTDENRINGALNAGAYYDESRKSGNTPCPYVWQLPYGTSGYFMAWLRYYDGDFLRKLTVSINNLGSEWSLDKAVQYILGDQYDIETLWNEYIEDVKKEQA